MSQNERHASLSRDAQETVAAELQEMLVELVDLALVGKQLQWSVVGAGFLSLRGQLDELVASWRALTDLVAERARAAGTWPDGQARSVADTCEILGHELLDIGAVDAEEVLQELTSRLAEGATRARVHAANLASIDRASERVMLDVVQALEGQLWTIRAQRAPDGRRDSQERT